MKILITGANGFLGQHLCLSLRRAHEVYAMGRGERRISFPVNYFKADLQNGESVRQAVHAAQPDVIVHAAAMSRPDECLSDPAACDAVNIGGTGHLLNAAAGLERPPHFIYISTDFVFGEGGPHDEMAVPAPLNYYGLSKLKAEGLVKTQAGRWTIVRPVFMYGPSMEGQRSTFLHWVKQSLEEGRQIKVVNDQMRTPTFVGDICAGIAAVIGKEATGIFHLGGEEVLSPYRMAVELAGWCGLDAGLLIPVTADEFPEPVRRARRGGLRIEKSKSELGFNPINFAKGLELSFPR